VLRFAVVDELDIMLTSMDGNILSFTDGIVLGSEVGTTLDFILGCIEGKILE